jgi:hypothetical protein
MFLKPRKRGFLIIQTKELILRNNNTTNYNTMSDALQHECGIALVRLLKPLEFYKEKYGTVLRNTEDVFTQPRTRWCWFCKYKA